MHLKVCAALLLLTPAAFASSVDLKTQLQSCQQISGEEQRLSCFDQVVAQLDKLPATTLAPAPSANSAVSSPVRATATTEVQSMTTPAAVTTSTATTSHNINDEFGLKKPDPVDELQQIVSIVKSTTLDKRKKLLINLENGQQWQQIDQGYIKIKSGDRCTVTRGAIGSFLLSVDGITKTIRVRRVE